MIELLEKIPVDPLMQKFIGVGIIIMATFIGVFITKIAIKLLIKNITAKTKTALDDTLVAIISRPIIWLIYLIGASILFKYIKALLIENIGEPVFNFFDGLIYSLGVIVVASLITKIFSAIVNWYGSNIASQTETKVNDEFMPLLDRALKIIVYTLASLIVLDHFKVDVKGLIAVLGIGSLAIALAAQETLANMIGGFVIMIDRPFRTGDWIQFDDGRVCQVDQIGVRSTKLLTIENTLIIVPNSELMKSTIHNVTYPYPEIKIKIEVGVGYDSDIDIVKKVMLDEADKQEHIQQNPAPIFRFEEFGDSSLNVMLICSVPEVTYKFEAASQLRVKILKRFREENIEIPFPQSVVTFVNKPDLD